MYLTKSQEKKSTVFFFHLQGSHRLEKYLNIQDCLEKSLKIKFALKLKSTWKHSLTKALKSPWIVPLTGGFNTVLET